jgi:G3E family GTPase
MQLGCVYFLGQKNRKTKMFNDILTRATDPLAHLADASLPTPRAVLLAGPLGSGKTTLLNHLLERNAANAPAGSFVVIENDIGARNTDAARIVARPEDVLAITAGCICCNDLHSLSAAIDQIKGTGVYRTMFIETTGIANPGAVKDLLHTAGIPTKTVVTVDVKHFEQNRMLRRDTDTVPHADIIALTWWEDDVPAETIAQTIAAIKTENDTAPLLFVSSSGRPVNPMLSDTLAALPREAEPFALDRRAFLPRRLAPLEQTTELRLAPTPPPESAHRHHTFTATLSPSPGITPEKLQEIVTRGVGTALLLRAKGHLDGFEFDCTHGDWRFYQSDRGPRRNIITMMSDFPLTAASFPEFTPLQSDSAEVLDLTDAATRNQAVKLVQDLLRRIPTDVVAADRLVTETEAGEAWRYVSNPGFPAKLREKFLRELLDFYLRQHTVLRSGRFDSSPVLPYYKREVGYNLSWFNIDCGAELERWGMREQVADCKPCALYFEGLAEAKTALHMGSFRESDTPYLRRRLAALAIEIGVQQGRRLATRAVDNCTRLSLNGTWQRALPILSEWEQMGNDAV